MTTTLYHGDCLNAMRTLPDGSVDAVIADPPYGTTNCRWDAVIPLDAMWGELRRVTRKGSPIVIFAGQPFTSVLIASNLMDFRHAWVWDKRTCAAPPTAKYRPLLAHEDIAVFGRGVLTYNPEMVERTEAELKRLAHSSPVRESRSEHYPGLALSNSNRYANRMKYPSTLLRITGLVNSSREKVAHPTQKPVDLLAYLVRTYTNPGETVLDFCMGSGTTGVACVQEGRDFIGIEREASYYAIAERRIAAAQPPLFAEVAD